MKKTKKIMFHFKILQSTNILSMNKRNILTLSFLFLLVFSNAQINEIIRNPCSDSTLFYVNFYVDDTLQNKPFEIYFLDSTNQIIRPKIYCNTCTPKLYVKPNNYICDSCSHNLLSFVIKNNEHEIKIDRLWLNRVFVDVEIGVITEPHKLVKCYTEKELIEIKKDYNNQKSWPLNVKIGLYTSNYYLYYTPKKRHCFFLDKIGRRTKQIQYAHVGRCDSIGPFDYYNYIGNKHSSFKRWCRYWGMRLKW
jgi:uncharacterized CHY-type Zn-finger protein